MKNLTALITGWPGLVFQREKLIEAVLNEAKNPLRAKIHEACRSVCGDCNNDVPMECYNMHRSGFDCDALRYRDVLAMMGFSHTESVKAV